MKKPKTTKSGARIYYDIRGYHGTGMILYRFTSEKEAMDHIAVLRQRDMEEMGIDEDGFYQVKKTFKYRITTAEMQWIETLED